MQRVVFLALALAFALLAPAAAQEKSCVAVLTIHGAGSGTCIAHDGTHGVFLTNKHVIDKDEKVWILHEGKRYPATFLKAHASADLAVVRAAVAVPAAPLAATEPAVGSAVRHFGRATGTTWGQSGKVTGLTKFVSPDGTVLNSDLFSIPGDSGAALFNAQGQIVAVHYAVLGDPAAEERKTAAVRLESIKDFVKPYVK